MPERRRYKILLIEDNPADARLFQELLAEITDSLELAVADRLETGLQSLATQDYDAVLLDLSLPDSAGISTFREVYQRAARLPIVVLTGFDDEELAAEAMRHGAQDYLVKGRVDGPLLARSLRYAIERKEAEAALRASEERFRRVFEDAPVGMALVETDLRISDVNKAFTSMLGFSKDELVGDTFELFSHPGDHEADRQLALEVLRGELEHAPKLQRRFVKKSRDNLWVEASASVIRDGRGRALYALGMFEDLTERRKIEAQLRQSQKMEAIGQLAGGVAHDFNNLLTVILGYTELLVERLGTDDPRRTTAEQIRKAGEKASSLTRQLLAFSREQVLEPKVLSLNSVVEDLEKMLWRLIGEDVVLEAQLASDLGPVKADRGQLEQVLLNLAVNSRDAMPEGGRLVIGTENVELAGAEGDALGGVPAGEYVRLSIADTGVGMDADTLCRVFEPFFTTKEPGKGTGLGLSTVYGIVKQSGGYLGVESEPGRGTTFHILLPRVGEAPSDGRERHYELAASPTGTQTLLLVEDEEDLRALAGMVLKDRGYSVLEAAGGNQALEICSAHGGSIDLLITDVVMPEMNGRELAEKLADSYPTLKVLYMSGYTDDAVVRRGIVDRGISFLQKPFTGSALANRVHEVLSTVECEPALRSGAGADAA